MIGSCKREHSSSSSNEYRWVHDRKESAPKDADNRLATALRNHNIEPITAVVDSIVERNLRSSAEEAIMSPVISERDGLNLLMKFNDLIDTFLSRDDFDPVKIKDAVKDTVSDNDALAILDLLIQRLESSLEDIDNQSQTHLIRCMRLVSMIIDGKFISWYVKSTGGSQTGTRLARLTAVVSKYRKLVIQDQQQCIRKGGEEGEKTETLIRSNQQPKHDGRIFFHSLVL